MIRKINKQLTEARRPRKSDRFPHRHEDNLVTDPNLLPSSVAGQYEKALRARGLEAEVTDSRTLMPRGWDYGNSTEVTVNGQKFDVRINVAHGEVSGIATTADRGLVVGQARGTTPEPVLSQLVGSIADHFGGSHMSESRRSEIDETAVHELVLYTINDGDIYRQTIQPIIKNLARKIKNGTYNETLAIQAWSYAADAGAKKYTEEFGGTGNGSYGAFSKADRMAAAKEIGEQYDEEVQSEARKGQTVHEPGMSEAGRRRSKIYTWSGDYGIFAVDATDDDSAAVAVAQHLYLKGVTDLKSLSSALKKVGGYGTLSDEKGRIVAKVSAFGAQEPVVLRGRRPPRKNRRSR